MHLFQGYKYKKNPFRQHRPFPNNPSSHSSPKHASLYQQSTSSIPRPSHPTCKLCLLSPSHHRAACGNPQWATAGIPSIRPSLERRSPTVHSTIWIPSVRDTLQQSSRYHREVDDPGQCRGCLSGSTVYHVQPIQHGRHGSCGCSSAGTHRSYP
jgi:hypothetical protein